MTEEIVSYGVLSLIPAILAVVLAFWTKNVIISLMASLFVGCLITAGWNPWNAMQVMFSDHLFVDMTGSSNAQTIIMMSFVGGFVALIEATGGAKAFAAAIANKVHRRSTAQTTAWLGGLAIFFSDSGNSLILGLSASLAAGVVGTLGAVGFDRVRPRSRRLIEYLTSLPLMTPEIILGMVFMAFFGMLGIPFGMGTLILSHTTFCIPSVFMLVQARLVGMDRSLAEAARDLGAGERQVFFTITLPLLLPAIVSGMLLSFAMSLDDVIISLFVTGVNVNTLPIKVYTALKTGVTPEINALCTLLLAATLLLVGLSMLWSKISRLTGSGR